MRQLCTLPSWPFDPPVLALAVLDCGRVLAVLTCRNIKVRMDLRQEQSIGGKFVIRGYSGTIAVRCTRRWGRGAAFPRDIHAYRQVRKPRLRMRIHRCASYINRGISPSEFFSRAKSNIRPFAYYGQCYLLPTSLGLN